MSFVSKIFSFFILASLASSVVQAQVYVFAGVHQNYIRSEIVVDTSPLTAVHLGGGVNFYISEQQKKPSFNAELAFVRKGYYQELGNRQFDLHFNYLTFQGTARYPIVNFLSVEGGINVGILVYANMKRWANTYSPVDVGLVGGLVFLEQKRIGFYTRAVYGMIPMVNYDRPDELGNFHGRVSDLKNTCFMVGIRFNVYEKEWCMRQ